MTRMQVVALFHLEPTVDGGFGESTVVEPVTDSDIPYVQRLEYCFDDWSGDELVTSFPCHLISKSLCESLTNAQVTGVATKLVTISRSSQFHVNSNVNLPEFLWLTPIGRISGLPKNIIPQRALSEPPIWSGHDVCLGPRAELVLSKAALNSIDLSRIPSCKIRAFPCMVNG